jgi:hypothetical protein
MRRTVEVARSGPRPTISLRRVPPCDPPYDDEREQPFWPAPDQLALDWSPAALARVAAEPLSTHDNAAGAAGTADAADAADAAGAAGTAGTADTAGTAGAAGRGCSGGALSAAALNRVPSATIRSSAPASSGTDAVAGEAWRSATGTLTAAHSVRPMRPVFAGTSTDAKAAVHRFVRLCVEVLNGYRPAAHLRRFSLPAEAAGIVTQGLAAAQRVASLRKAAQAAGRRPPRRPSPAAVVRLRLCEPRPGAVEAAVALVTGDRTWALALRLELHQDTWSATALRLI